MLNYIWKKFGQKKCRDRRPRRSVIIVPVALLANSTKRLVGAFNKTPKSSGVYRIFLPSRGMLGHVAPQLCLTKQGLRSNPSLEVRLWWAKIC